VKEVQERLTVLEEQNKNSPIEPVVTINKPQLSYDSRSDDVSKIASANNEALLHVDARILDKDVLIRIQCQKHKSFLRVKILSINNFFICYSLKRDRHKKINDGGIHLVIGPTTYFFVSILCPFFT